MSDRATGTLRRGRGWLLVLVCVAVWLSRMILPRGLPTSQLDDSWARGLGRALVDGLRAGVDYVFTFGPLGFFSTGSYLDELFWAKLLLWEGLFGLLLAVVLTMAGTGIENRVLRVVYFAVLILQPLHPDAQAFLPIAAALAWITRDRGARTAAIAVSAVVLAGLSLVKFTFAGAALVAMLAAAGALRLRGEGRRAAALLLAFFGLLVIGWIACGQSLADVPVYVVRSIQLSKGYAEAMSLEPPPAAVPLAIALLACATTAAWLHARNGPAPRSRAVAAIGQVALLLLVWKSGFVRAKDHTPIFFLFVAAAPLLYDLAGRPEGLAGRPEGLAGGPGGIPVRPGAAVERVSFATRFACAVFAIGLLFVGGTAPKQLFKEGRDPIQRIAKNAGAFLRPVAFRDRVAAVGAPGEQWTELPRTREIVGTSSIDMVTNLQLYLFRNGLRWTPRPVFQSYATFSPELMELNAGFLRGPQAPEFILFHLHAIDSRLPTMDDATALQVIARDYEPILLEKDRLLLRRNPLGTAPPSETVLAGSVAFGEKIHLAGLSGRCHLLRLDVRTTLAGRVASWLDASPLLHVEIELDDGDRFQARIVPGMMRSGVLIDPTLRRQADWVGWCAGRSLPRPVSLKVVTPPRPWTFEPVIGFEVLRADDVAPRWGPEKDHELAYSLFPTRPSGVRSDRQPGRRILFEQEVVMLSPTSEMTFEVRPGKRRLRGHFAVGLDASGPAGGTARGNTAGTAGGNADGTVDGPAGGTTDGTADGAAGDAAGDARGVAEATSGIAFRAVLSTPGSADVVLFEKTVDPRKVPEDRRLYSFDTTVDVAGPSKLSLVSSGAPGVQREVACWSAIAVE